MLSTSSENYLKCIFSLQEEQGGAVNTNSIAERMSTKASSVTDMVQKLSRKGWLQYRPYHGVHLTDDGRKLAVNVIRKHRLWEYFLVNQLKFRWDEVHDIAEQLEHIDSPELVKRLDRFLGHPRFDPHGDPIPDEAGNIIDDRDPVRLSSLKVGNIGKIVSVRDSSRDFLKFLEGTNLILGSKLEVQKIIPYDRSYQVRLAVSEVTISEKVADNLMIQVLF